MFIPIISQGRILVKILREVENILGKVTHGLPGVLAYSWIMTTVYDSSTFIPHYIPQIFFRNIALKWYKNDGTKIIQKWYKNDHSFNFIEKLCYKCIPVKFSHWSIIWLFSIRGALPSKATLHTGARKLRKLSCKLSLANFHQLLSSFNQSLKQLYCISQFTNSA
jgi:hypothetical protein